MNTKEEIETHIGQCAKLLEVVAKLPAQQEVCFNAYDAKIVVFARTMDELGAMRHTLRECLGSWTDKLVHVWESLGSGLASYESEEWPVEIRLRTPLADFPKEITGDTCRFVPQLETHWSYVCDRNEKGAAA